MYPDCFYANTMNNYCKDEKFFYEIMPSISDLHK
jgi:hypothetical protein